MATLVEDARHKLASTRKDRIDFAASFGDDKAPNEDDERKLDAMLNGEADLVAELGRLEKFEKQKAGVPSGDDHRPNPAKEPSRLALATLGHRLMSSEGYVEAMKMYAPNGRIPDGLNGHFQMAPIGFKGIAELSMMAALVTGDSATSAGAFVVTDRQRELVALGRQPLRMRDIITVLQTDSDLIEYVAQTSRTNSAATVAEATAASGASGVKPESALAFEVRTAPVVTIANWTPVTKRAVADVPQMRSIIDTELRDNLEETLEDKMLDGAGGTDITGITQTSGTQTQAWDTNILTTTRKALTLTGTVGRVQPNAYVLNPAEWEIIDLLQDNEARYFYGGPAQVGVPRLWGLPAVIAEALTAGTGLVGDFKKAKLWDREQASLAISDSHADFFIRNLLALLVEMRAAFALTQPSAIVEMDLTA